MYKSMTIPTVGSHMADVTSILMIGLYSSCPSHVSPDRGVEEMKARMKVENGDLCSGTRLDWLEESCTPLSANLGCG
jgi:hypothetical protein